MKKLSVFELLSLRYEWEEIVRTYKFTGKQGTIENLQNFRTYGYRGNRFRPGFDRAAEIATTILEHCDDT